eukprot:2640650-Rhodomonas_salina.1
MQDSLAGGLFHAVKESAMQRPMKWIQDEVTQICVVASKVNFTRDVERSARPPLPSRVSMALSVLGAGSESWGWQVPGRGGGGQRERAA